MIVKIPGSSLVLLVVFGRVSGLGFLEMDENQAATNSDSKINEKENR